MVDSVKVVRTLAQQEKLTGFTRPSLYGGDGKNVVFGSESNANFIDVLSVGPITSIEDIQVNDSTITTEEFPLSQFYLHTGEEAAAPFEGDFPYVERTISLSKQADVIEGDKYNIHTTDFKKAVSSLGVSGIRINFNTGQFVHRDKENRRKVAFANFRLHILDEDGNRKKSTGYSQPQYFYASNPTSINLSILADEEDRNRLWEYEVEMRIMTNNYGTTVSGTWSASTVTELYKDTQTYENIAMVSGKIVASDVGGSVPNRQYLVNGYKVDVPVYVGENNLFLGEFKKETSNSHAWNAMAVLTDDKWGGGLPLDKINIASFVEFDKYLSETLSDGSQRYSHSQELVKADNYFRIASQIVGAADGKLYEDTSGRIGVLVDKQTDSRRIITSYDIQDEKVKRTTVPEKKKTNYVQIEFDDETNNYLTTIVSTQNDIAITKNGLIQNNLKSDTCTNPLEAKRVIDKVLATSQYTPSSYVFSVGHTHEDVQIGEVVALYDRLHSRVNYCGKTAEGSTLTRIEVDPRTPISLEGISNPYLVLDSDRGSPVKLPILSWTDRDIELGSSLDTIPEAFTSFGVESGDAAGLKPALVRILGVTDNQGTLQLEGVDYNDSLYSHVENGTEIITPTTQILPELQEEIQSLTITKVTAGIFANWDDTEEGTYVYFWKKFTGDTERDPNNTGILVTSGQTGVSNNTLPLPLEPARYEFSVYILNELTGESSSTKSVSIDLDITDSATSLIPQPTNFDTEEGQGRYEGRGFTLKWDQVVGTETPYLMGYILRITQGGDTLEYRLTSDYRSYQITPQALTEVFGEDYSRSFTVRLVAYDDTLLSAPTVTRVVNNTAPISPEISVRVTGDILLSSDSGVPEETIGSLVYVWESSDVNSARPTTASVFSSNQVAEIDLPNDTLVYDNRDYVFEAAWIDGFGEIGANYGRSQIAFGPDVLIPEPMNLIRANAYSITGIQVEFEHDGVWLEKMKVYYRKTNESGEFLLDDSYLFEGDVRVSYDEGSQSGTFIIEELDYNSEYEIYTTVSNISSADSESSGTVIGITVPYADVTDIVEEINQVIDDIEIIRNEVDGEFRPQLNLEILSREATDRELFNTTASLAQFRRATSEFEDSITNAVFKVNPDDGSINLRAYSYTDEAFTQAGVLIDGVNAEVNIQAKRITDLDGEVKDANAEINVLAGQVELKASYTEMEEYVAGALDAVIPAYSFGFFDSTEGWSAVNGTLTAGTNMALAMWGDIENQTLNYSADENPVITLTVKRSAGDGHTGDLVVTFEDTSTQTYTGVISDVSLGNTNVKNLNLAGEDTYTGTVTGLRIILGTSVADEYEIESITIGKPSAQLDALDGITAQVNQLGVDVNAIEGQLTSFVTTTYYDENTVTLNNVTQVLDGEEAIISLKATQNELNEQGTVTKANSASTWIDGANATIRDQVISFNAEDGSIDDQIAGITGSLNSVEQELSTIDGAMIRSQLVSINRLEIESKDLSQTQFYAEIKLLDQRNKDLKLGDSVAIANESIRAVSDEQGSLSQAVTDLQASTGTIEGQVNANAEQILTAKTDIEGNAQSIATLNVDVENAQGDIASAQQQLQAVSDEQGLQATAITNLELEALSANNRITANSTAINSVSNTVDGQVLAIAGLESSVEDVEGDLTNAQLTLSSTVNELGEVSSRAYLGVSNTIDGKTNITGITADSSTNGLRFQGDVVQFDDTSGNPALQYRSDLNKWVFTGNVVVGGYTVSSEADIRGLDGKSAFNFYSDTGNVAIIDGDFSKSTSNGSWNASVVTEESYSTCVVSARLNSSKQSFIGLSGSGVNGDFRDVDYAIYGLSNGALQVYQNGVPINVNTWYNTSDKLSVVNDGNQVYYQKNGVTFYTSTTAPQGDYFAVALLYNTGTSVYDAMFAPSGSAGGSGAGFYGDTYSSISWTTSTANSRFSALVGRDPVELDIFTQTRTDGSDSQARQYNGSSWEAVALQVNGSIVARRTIAGDKLIAGTEISAPRIVGGDVIGSKVATAEGSSTRVELEDDGTYMQWIGTGSKNDTNALFYVKKNGTGFIKGDFFQGEIIATVTGSASNINNNLTAQTQSYNSAGKTAVVNFSASCSLYKNELNSDANMTLTVKLYRGNTLIETISQMANKFYEAPEAGVHNGRTYFSVNMSDMHIDNGTPVGTNSYKIVTTYSGVSSPIVVTRNTAALTAQEDKLS